METPFLSAEDFDERAHQLYDIGDYDQALEVLHQGLTKYPDAVELHVGLGYVRLAREEFVWAKQSFDAALRWDPENEDAWVGRGESLLKFGRNEDALVCFARVNELGLADDLELGLAIGRALYREGMFHESRERLLSLAAVQRDSAEVKAALGYTLHALGDEAGARRELRQALLTDPGFHEARIYLSHLLFERGDHEAALRELERIPADEHWDPLSLWRTLELKCSIDGCCENDPVLEPWQRRIEELDGEPDEIDHLLAEVEAGWELADLEPAGESCCASVGREQAEAGGTAQVHRVCTADGAVFVGTWEQIVIHMRNALSDPEEPIATFMYRASERIRRLMGCDLPCHDPEAFLRESARIGLLRIDR